MPVASVLLALALASSGPAAACPDDARMTLGPSTAPTEVEAYLDPASRQSWRTWLELRRLVADRGGELRVTLRWVAPSVLRQPHADRVRAFVAALAARGHVTLPLRAVARDGLERLHARLVDPAAHEALARELRVEPAVIDQALRDRCARAALERDGAALHERLAIDDLAAMRLPQFTVGRLLFDDGPGLDRLRPELGLAGLRQRDLEEPAPPGAPPSVQAISDRMRHPPLRGLLLGGPGLPHRFVLMARDEDDPLLFVALPPVLDQRHRDPGRLAIHVVSRGMSSGAEQLRHRLCAARELGLGVAYLDYLGRDALLRDAPDAIDERLLAALDEVPAERCADEPNPVDLDLPDGAWLDGLPRSRAELGTLDATLRLLDAAERPLDEVFPPVDEEL